jgi:hypothetical protein
MESKLSPGDKVVYLPEKKVYDFGFYSSTRGKAVIYSENKRNTSRIVDSTDIQAKDIFDGCGDCGSRRRNSNGDIFHKDVKCTK